MKANEAPKSLYFAVNKDLIGLYDSTILDMFSEKTTETAIEYIRKDAFIEKALKFIKANVDRIANNQYSVRFGYLDEDFKKYIEE